MDAFVQPCKVFLVSPLRKQVVSVFLDTMERIGVSFSRFLIPILTNVRSFSLPVARAHILLPSSSFLGLIKATFWGEYFLRAFLKSRIPTGMSELTGPWDCKVHELDFMIWPLNLVCSDQCMGFFFF